MRRSLLWIVLIVAGGFALWAASRGSDDIGGLLRGDDFASIGVKVILAVFIGGMVLTLYREKLSKALEAALLWAAIAAVLAVGYAYRHELSEVMDRTLAELIPGRTATRGSTVEIARGQAGEFSVSARVNDARVSMLLDTGASAVVLSHEAARAAGLPTGFLSYSVRVDTANGHTQAAPVTLDRLSVGGITERSVPALIAQPGQLRTSLLGMTFLNRLDGWEVRSGRLVLRGKT